MPVATQAPRNVRLIVWWTVLGLNAALALVFVGAAVYPGSTTPWWGALTWTPVLGALALRYLRLDRPAIRIAAQVAWLAVFLAVIALSILLPGMGLVDGFTPQTLVWWRQCLYGPLEFVWLTLAALWFARPMPGARARLEAPAARVESYAITP